MWIKCCDPNENNSHNGKSNLLDNMSAFTLSASSHNSTCLHDGNFVPLRRTPSLHENMMRLRKNRDPRKFYEIIEVLGEGSMGTVSKIKKRDEIVGGTARRRNVSLQNRIKHMENPLHIIPLVGGWLKDNLVDDNNRHACDCSLECSDEDSLVSSTKYIHTMGTESTKSTHDSPLNKKITFTPDVSFHKSTLHGNRSFHSFSASCHGKKNEDYYFALKSIHLAHLSDQAFVNELKNEIAILKTLDHPFIVRPIETFEFRKNIYMVMELCSGGDLYSRDPYTEEQAARIITCVLSAVSFMHENGVVHRDLKYENIMFSNRSPNAEIKLIDFGLSKKFMSEVHRMNDGVGTVYTMAPEVLKGDYTNKADIWSIGVILYMLLSSQMPFYGKRRIHVVEKIMSGKFDFRGKRWKNASSQAKNLVSSLLQLKPDERPTAEEAQSNLWLNKRFAISNRNVSTVDINGIQYSLKTYSKYSKLKKLALLIIAHRSTADEVSFLRKVFQLYDKGMTGTLSYERFREFFIGSNDDDVKEIFYNVDLDGTGKIRYTEFLAATIQATGIVSEERVAEAFDRLDSDESGYITAENLYDILGVDVPKRYIEQIIHESDLHHHHRITYDDFLTQWDESEEEKKFDM